MRTIYVKTTYPNGLEETKTYSDIPDRLYAATMEAINDHKFRAEQRGEIVAVVDDFNSEMRGTTKI